MCAAVANEDQALPTLLASRRSMQAKPGWAAVTRPTARPDALLIPFCTDGDVLPAAPSPQLPAVAGLALRMRNTFIDTAESRSPSLERFYRQREVSTCPSSYVGRLRDAFRDERGHELEGSPRGKQVDCAEHDVLVELVMDVPQPAAARPVISLASAIGQGQAAGFTFDAKAAPYTPSWASPSQPGPGQLSDAPAGMPGMMVTPPASAGMQGVPPLPAYGAPPSMAYGYPSEGAPPAAQACLWHVPGTHPFGAVGAPPPAQPFHSYVPTYTPEPPVPQHPANYVTRFVEDPRTQQADDTPDPSIPPPPSGPALGSEGLPSVGSRGHGLGECKPCAFFHRGLCGNGLLCQFCHLCDADERKRRRREKMESKRTAQRARQGAKVVEDESP